MKKKKTLDSTNQGSKAALNVDAADIKNKVTAASHFINTPKFNKLMKTSLNATMKQAEKILASKLKSIIHQTQEIKMKKTRKLQTFDFGYFFSKRHFEGYGVQNYFVF